MIFDVNKRRNKTSYDERISKKKYIQKICIAIEYKSRFVPRCEDVILSNLATIRHCMYFVWN